MVKRIWIDFVVLVVLCGSFIGVWYGCDLGKVTVEKIVIKTEYKEKIVYKETPGDCAEFKAAFFDPWHITGKTRDMYLDVTAQNKYIRIDKTFKMGCEVKPIKDQIGIGPGFLIVYDNLQKKMSALLGGTLQYTHWWGRFGLAPAVHVYGALDKNTFAGGADILLNYRFN